MRDFSWNFIYRIWYSFLNKFNLSTNLNYWCNAYFLINYMFRLVNSTISYMLIIVSLNLMILEVIFQSQVQRLIIWIVVVQLLETKDIYGRIIPYLKLISPLYTITEQITINILWFHRNTNLELVYQVLVLQLVLIQLSLPPLLAIVWQ